MLKMNDLLSYYHAFNLASSQPTQDIKTTLLQRFDVVTMSK